MQHFQSGKLSEIGSESCSTRTKVCNTKAVQIATPETLRFGVLTLDIYPHQKCGT